MMPRVLLLGSLVLTLWTASSGQDVTGWRGDGTGVFPDTNPPTHWSREKNVIWAREMSTWSNSQPALSGDRLFVCAEPFELICMRLSDGKILWQKSNSYHDVTTPEEWTEIEKELKVADRLRGQLDVVKARVKELERRPETSETEAALEAAGSETVKLEAGLKRLPLAGRYTLPITQKQFNGYTTATPTTNGEYVWAVFGNRVVACYSMDGQREWAIVLPDHPQVMWGHSTSPLLIDNRLIICIDHIVALDTRTGKELWRTKYGQSWGSPVRARIGDEDVIFMANGRMLRASDGKLVARHSSPLERASPVVHDGAVYYVGFGGTVYDLPRTMSEELDLKERWTADTRGSLFTASPVVHNGLIYAVASQQILNVLDDATGETVYVKRLKLGREPVWPSLCIAGKYLYISSRDGTTLVVETGREYKEVATNVLEFFISSPVFHENRMYLRTNEHVYCIGEKR